MKKLTQVLFLFLFSTVLFAEMDIQQCQTLINKKGQTTSYKQVDAYYKCMDELALKRLLAKYFHFNNDKMDDMQAFYTKTLTNFYIGLRDCKAGDYEFIMNMNSFVKAKIQGIHNDSCAVDMDYQYDNASNNLGPAKQHCEIERVNLPLFTDNAALVMTAFTEKQLKDSSSTPELAKTSKQAQEGVTSAFNKYCKSLD